MGAGLDPSSVLLNRKHALFTNNKCPYLPMILDILLSLFPTERVCLHLDPDRGKSFSARR